MHQPSSGSGHITLLFSGRAMHCHARRRRARVGVSRSAATACYVRLPPNLPDRDPFDLRWTLRLDRRRTKGTEHIEADELSWLATAPAAQPPPDRQHAGACTDARVNSADRAPACACERRSRRENEDSTECSEAGDARARHNAAALAARGQEERIRGGSAAETKSLHGERRRLCRCASPLSDQAT